MPEIVRLTVVPPGEAEVICAFLRSEGILCKEGTTPLVLSEQMAGVGSFQEIFVRDVDLPRARELLESRIED